VSGRAPSGRPTATARLQFHRGFTLDDAAAIVPYLADLGISHLYASPLLAARAGSTHGYDVVDPDRVNPELGGEAAFERLVAALHARGLGLIVDIVPNHMGVGPQNRMWMDVLEWGRHSRFAPVFDIQWDAPQQPGRVFLPLLIQPYGDALLSGSVGLSFDRAGGRFAVECGGLELPLNPQGYAVVLHAAAEHTAGSASDLLEQVAARFAALAAVAMPDRCDRAASCRAGLLTLMGSNERVHAAIDAALGPLGPVPRDAFAATSLHNVLECQSYRLAFWRVASAEINYRRFFEINDLVGVRVEDPAVFTLTHGRIEAAWRAGHIQGLRIDHIDGLADPDAYLARLAGWGRDDGERTAPPYVVVEKILATDEDLPATWPVAGTTGYEIANLLHGVQVDGAAEEPMCELWSRFTGDRTRFGQLVPSCRREILDRSFVAPFEALVAALDGLARSGRSRRDLSIGSIRRALTETVVHLPVYRAYVRPGALIETPAVLDRTIAAAAAELPAAARPALALVSSVLSARYVAEDEALGAVAADIAIRFQQLTGAIAAKAVEDTAFYRSMALVSLNEVGGTPERFGVGVGAFHAAMQRRVKQWPQAQSALATHDHKRGADLRARLAVLTEMPSEWALLLQRLSRATAPFKRMREGRMVPARAHEYLFYQTVLGAWPLTTEADAPLPADFADRVAAYMLKAAREGKRETDWIDPDERYEAGLESFVRGALDARRGRTFLAIVAPFVHRIGATGAVNGLAQLVLQATIPGVPDLYQGTEGWDLSLVDPDNRRPVDFPRLAADLADMQGKKAADFAADWRSGRVKQRVLASLLHHRRAEPALFAQGSYHPLAVQGPLADRVIAFRRSERDRHLVVAVPRLVCEQVVQDGSIRLTGFAGTTLPDLPSGRWRDLLGGRTPDLAGPLDLDAPFSRFPALVLAA
jgi:(1->4)-alpha-D-glucan 1-alpha-D-glucosylmutase